MIDKSTRFSLLSGVPITVEKVGCVHPLTLREIGIVTEKKYNEFLSLLCLDKHSLKLDEVDEAKELNSFDILVANALHDESFKNDLEKSLSLFLKERVTFIPDYLIFYVGEDVEELRFIHRENYDEIVAILKMQNNLAHKPKERKKKLSKKAELLLKKRGKGRQLLAKAKGQDDISLGDLVSAMGVFVQDINRVLDMTVYQFYNQYEKFMKRENYKNNFDMYLVGADSKKLNLEHHWTSR